MEDLILRIRALFEDSGMTKLEKGMRKIAVENERINQAAKSATITMNRGLSETTKIAKQAQSEMKSFKMEWLSMLFFGQAIQRTFGGILRASFKTWSTVTEGTSEAGGQMGKLGAAWEFFKYSLFDALLNSGLFNNFVDFVLWLVDGWSNLSDSTKTLVADIITMAAVIGSIMATAGTIVLGLQGTETILAKAGDLKLSISKAIGVIGIAWALYEGVKAYDDFQNGKFYKGITGALASVAAASGGLLIMSGAGAAGGTMLLIAFGLHLLNEGVFFEKLFSLAGLIVGLFYALGKQTGDVFGAIMSTTILGHFKEMLFKIADSISAFLPNLARGIRRAVEGLMGPQAGDFDMSKFIADVVYMQNKFEDVGAGIDSYINQQVQAAEANAQAKLDGNVASFPDQMSIANVDDIGSAVARNIVSLPRTNTQMMSGDGYEYYSPNA